MAILDIFLGAEEDQLAKPAPDEDKNLETHVELCARRYKTLAERLRGQNRLLWASLILGFINIAPEKLSYIAKLF